MCLKRMDSHGGPVSMECWKVVRTTVLENEFSSPHYEADFILGEWSGVSGFKHIPLPWDDASPGTHRSYVVGFHAYLKREDAMDALRSYRRCYGSRVALVRATMQEITAIGVEDIECRGKRGKYREVEVVVGRLIHIEEVVA